MIHPVPCACGNARPEVVQTPDGGVVIRCRCGQKVRGGTFADAEDAWARQVAAWLDMRSEVEQRRGVD